jgi:hypothetical protein
VLPHEPGDHPQRRSDRHHRRPGAGKNVTFG